MPSAITLTVSNLSKSTSFFLSALQPLEYQYRGATDNNTTIAFGPAFNPDSPPDFWLTQEVAGVPAGAAHVAFPAKTRIAVQQFFNAALKAGARVHGEPAVRDASTGYYSGAVIDFDGNSIEAVYRPIHPEDNKENVTDGDNSIGRAATSAEISRTLTTSHSPKAEATKAPSSLTKVHSAQSGDVIDVAANLARNVASHLRPAPSHSTASLKNGKEDNDTRGSKATIGALLGVAAGAALTYAFGSKDKDKDRDSKERHRHHPLSPSRSSTYPSYSARRHHSSASDLAAADYRYTQSPLEIAAPPPLQRRSSSCHSPSSSRRRDPTIDDFEHHHHRRRHRRESSGTAHGGNSRRSRRNSLQPVDAPPPPPPSTALTTATSKHSHHSHSSGHGHGHGHLSSSDASSSPTTTKPSSKRDRTSYPPSAFSPTTKSKLVSAAGPSPTTSESTLKPARRSTTTDRTPITTTRPRRNSKSSSHSHTTTLPTNADANPPAPAAPQPQPHPQPLPTRRRPRAGTWSGPDSRLDRNRDHDRDHDHARWRVPHPHPHPDPHARRRPDEDLPPAVAAAAVPAGPGSPPQAPRPPAPPLYRRKSRSHGDSGGDNNSGGNRDRLPHPHRSRKGSMRRRRVVGADFDDVDFGGGGGVYGDQKGADYRGGDEGDWERELRERGLKGGIMDREIGPDDSISQVSTNVVG